MTVTEYLVAYQDDGDNTEAHQAWHDYAALEANLKGHRLIYIETDMANHGVSVTAIALPRAQCQCGLWMHARNTTLLAELYAHHIGQVMHKAHEADITEDA